MIKKTLLFILPVLMLLSACASSGGNLAGTEWELVSLDGDTQVGEVIGGHAVTIGFQDTEVSGSAGCNGYGGTYQVSGSRITFSELVSTLMACESDGVMAVEQAFLQALGSADQFSVSGNTLTITGGGHTLIFERM